MMMNGSSHDWKFTTISRYTSTMANARPASSPKYELLHRLDLSAHAHEAVPRGRDFSLSRHNFIDVSADRTKIAALHVAVDIERAADVVVMSPPAFHCCALIVATSARISGCFAVGDEIGIFCRSVQMTDLILRRLRHDVVVDAVLPVQKKHRGSAVCCR